MERGTAQPTQSGISIKLRKNSKLGQILFDAFITRNYEKLNAVKILQKFEFADGDDADTCIARLEEDVMIAINNFNGEAGGFLGFEIDLHYANKSTIGTMPKEDGETITFTPNSAA
jgi:hypothetical protein